jgi:hypothetical protein
VGTIEMDLGVRAAATRVLVDGALAALDRGDQLETVERGTFKQSGRTFVVRPIVHTRCSRARHDTLIQRATSVHASRRSTGGRTRFEPGRNL